MNDEWDTKLQVEGEERKNILTRVEQQVQEWDLQLPDVNPLIIHFGLNDFWNTGLSEYWIANEEGAGYCGKFLFLFDQQTCPAHRHKKKHETFFVVKGRITMHTDQNREMTAGDRFVMEPGIEHSFTAHGNALVLEVSMPSTLNDNFFADSDIGENGVI